MIDFIGTASYKAIHVVLLVFAFVICVIAVATKDDDDKGAKR